MSCVALSIPFPSQLLTHFFHFLFPLCSGNCCGFKEERSKHGSFSAKGCDLFHDLEYFFGSPSFQFTEQIIPISLQRRYIINCSFFNKKIKSKKRAVTVAFRFGGQNVFSITPQLIYLHNIFQPLQVNYEAMKEQKILWLWPANKKLGPCFLAVSTTEQLNSSMRCRCSDSVRTSSLDRRAL